MERGGEEDKEKHWAALILFQACREDGRVAILVMTGIVDRLTVDMRMNGRRGRT